MKVTGEQNGTGKRLIGEEISAGGERTKMYAERADHK
jgi:hypothetical protein